MKVLRPKTLEELADALAGAAAAGRRIRLGGAFTKDRMGGPASETDVAISTAGLCRIVEYDPRDLTISVEAGLPFAELERTTGAYRQMAPLDPPFHAQATVGGVVAANTNGPRRRLYGSCRDLVIGMKFVTLEGKIVSSGGMVVKNVAGLDMAKLMIGSMGTLAAIAVVNFRLAPLPPATCTYLSAFSSLEQAFAARNALLKSCLQPAAIDLLNPAASARLDREGWLLLVQVGGTRAVLARYAQELGGTPVEGEAEAELWRRIREFTPEFLAAHPGGAVLRISSTLSGLREAMGALAVPVLARAGTGVCYAYFHEPDEAARALQDGVARGWRAVMEFLPVQPAPGLSAWPAPGADFAIMEKIKRMFDPGHLLNPGRLYGRL
jgi:glycolate oxidase FAD binding subunit